MRIGILTYHHSINNGAVMQAYSLATKLKSRHPECNIEIVNYQMERINTEYSYALDVVLRRIPPIRLMKILVSDPCYLHRYRRREKIIREGQNRLPLSPACIISDGTEAVFRYINERYDLLIVGSDAIWNYKLRGFPNAYLPDTGVMCRKMSYAASCYGMEYLSESVRERDRIGQWLSDFSFIGVRDVATEQFVTWSGCTVPPAHTCDPTVFLDVNALPVDAGLLRGKLESRGFDFSKPTIGMMGTTSMLKMIRKMYGSQYQIAALYDYVKGADVNLYDLDPYEWAYVFRYFKMTFTTFFHGMLLSLRNGIPVVCIALDSPFGKVHTPKTLDLLSRLGFAHWYFETDYKTLNVERIQNQANEFLVQEYRQQILDAMDREAESFEVFDKTLHSLINKEESYG